MRRTARQLLGGMFFHVLNRGNARDRVFADDAGNGNRKGNHFGRQKGAGSAIEKGTTLLTHN